MSSSSDLNISEVVEAACSCSICGDRSSGIHYKVSSCDGCRGFFKRAVRNGFIETCKNNNNCVVNKESRNSCKSCRFKKCLNVGMEPSSVQQRRDRVVMKLFDSNNLDNRSEMSSSESQGPSCSSGFSSGSNSYTSMEVPRDYSNAPHKFYPMRVPRIISSESTFRQIHVMQQVEERKLYEYGQLVPDDDEVLYLHPGYSKEPWVCLIKSSFESMITWLNEVPFLLNLTLSERCLLMENNWCSLFIVSLSKHQMYLDQTRMLHTLYLEHQRRAQLSSEEESYDEITDKICESGWNPEYTNNLPPTVRNKIKILYSAMTTLYRIREIEQQLIKLDMDSSDLSYLKCLSLMNPGIDDYNFWSRVTRTYQELMSSFIKYIHEKTENCSKPSIAYKIGVIMTTLTSIKCLDPEKIAYAFSPIIRFKEPMDSRFWSNALSKYRKLPLPAKYI